MKMKDMPYYSIAVKSSPGGFVGLPFYRRMSCFFLCREKGTTPLNDFSGNLDETFANMEVNLIGVVGPEGENAAYFSH